MNMTRIGIHVVTAINTLLLAAFAFTFGIYPFFYVVGHLWDPALREPGMPRVAKSLHRSLSPEFEDWARSRVASGRAHELTTDDLIETEWPVFGAGFYLWGTEALERDHRATVGPGETPPSEYAAGAIDAATDLLLDPGHATWVRQHWGEDYLYDENIFYRMLLIAGADSTRYLTGSEEYDALIADQVATLSTEIHASPSGLLDDYPAECYPGDVLAGIAAIKRSGEAIPVGREHFLERARRGFEGQAVDALGLPPYLAERNLGVPIGTSRGCSSSYLTFVAPEVWPDKAQDWYARYEEHFWQETLGSAGFREFPRSTTTLDWSMGDMDSGPIIGGYGMAACAFALAAARSNGRYDHAYPLATQMIAASWPLPDGTLLLPRILSSATDAPHLGEAAIFFNLSRQPVEGMPIVTGGSIPGQVYAILGTYAFASGLVLFAAWRGVRRVRGAAPGAIRWPQAQLAMWTVFTLSGLVHFMAGTAGIGLLLLALAQVFPRVRTKRTTMAQSKPDSDPAVVHAATT